MDLARLSEQQLAQHLDALEQEDAAVKAKLDAPDALARAARWYAAHGIAVFPLRPGAKMPLAPKAHPDDPTLQRECKRTCGRDGHGLYDATTDLDRVARWWTDTPQANIGLPTGINFDVVDIDGPTGMRTYIEQIRHGQCPRRDDGITPACCDNGNTCHGSDQLLNDLTGGVLGTARTAGENGGLHFYMRPTGDPNGTSILPGVDYRGVGGFVVAPPSRGRLGRYTWQQPLNPTALAVAA